MIEISPAEESDVVVAFLRAETDRWHNNESIQNFLRSVGVTNQQLTHADFKGDYSNRLRAIVLDAYRGYIRKGGLFTRFPNGVIWRRAELEPADLNRLKFVKSIEWVPLSDGTRQPQRVVEKLARHEVDAAFAQKVAAIRESLKRGEILPELAAVEGEGTDLILIEGAHRTTAYVSLGWNKNVQAFVGNSPFMRDWAFY